MMQRIKRIWCDMWGCRDDEDFTGCTRCGSHYYGGHDGGNPFYTEGRLFWLQCRVWRVKWWLRDTWQYVSRAHICAECGERMERWNQRKDSCCSEECYQQHVPF